MARPEHGAISLVAFRRARGDGPFEAAWGERYLSARFRQIQRNHKHGRREHVEHKSKHSIHSVGWLGVCARKSTHPTPQSARQVEGSSATSCKDVVARTRQNKIWRLGSDQTTLALGLLFPDRRQFHPALSRTPARKNFCG